jgi:hypothetical protein
MNAMKNHQNRLPNSKPRFHQRQQKPTTVKAENHPVHPTRFISPLQGFHQST